MTDYRIPSEYKPLFFWTKDRDNPPYRYYDFSGGRSSGKSTTVALALALEGTIYPTRVLCGREYQNSIKDSVKKLLENIIEDLNLPGYSSTLDGIRNRNGTEFIFKGLHDNLEATVKSLEGVRRCWIEEAQTISKESLDILLPTIRVPGSTVIFTRNPLTPEDAVTRRFVTEPTELIAKRTYHKHLTWRSMERAGILSSEIKQQILEAEGTPEFSHVWEGLPYERTLNQIISWEALNKATQRPADNDGAISFGIDVARYGNDRTALAIKQGHHLLDLTAWRHASLTESATRIIDYNTKYHPTTINIDDTGVGGGLTDILVDHQLPVVGVNFGAKAKQADKYPSVASELWFDFAEQLPYMTINPQLPFKAELFQELSTREWKINTRNQRQVQAKSEYKSINDTVSPDLADSVLLAYYQPAVMPEWDVEI